MRQQLIKECQNKGYIATFKLKNQKVFVANPRYTLNGRHYLQVIVDLFDELNNESDGEE